MFFHPPDLPGAGPLPALLQAAIIVPSTSRGPTSPFTPFATMSALDFDLLSSIPPLPSIVSEQPSSAPASSRGPIRHHRAATSNAPYITAAARERVGSMVSRTVPEQLASLAAPTRPVSSLECTTAVHAQLAKVQQDFVMESISSLLRSWLQDHTRFNDRFISECERMGQECNKLQTLAHEPPAASSSAEDAAKQQCILYWEAGDEGVLYWNSEDEGEEGEAVPSASSSVVTPFAATLEGAAAVATAIERATPQSPTACLRWHDQAPPQQPLA